MARAIARKKMERERATGIRRGRGNEMVIEGARGKIERERERTPFIPKTPHSHIK